jgi:putative ABC transport system permease protein
MLFLTKLAFKNLARHRNRTIITASIIAIAIFVYIYLDSMIGGMVELSYRTIIDYESGHLQVVKEDYWEAAEKLPLDDLFVPDQWITDLIEQGESYAAFSPELSFQAQLYNGTVQLPVIGKGIIPEAFSDVFALENQFVEGSMVRRGQDQVVLGKRLADLLQLRTGDYITLQVKDKNKTFNTIDAEIVGLVHTSNPNVNQNIVYLPLDLVQEALSVGVQVSKVIVRLENKDQAAKVAPKLAAELQRGGAELKVYPWTELEAVSFANAQYVENQIILVLILGIAAIAVINTVILAALERMEEIGMMKAMGLQNKEIIYTFVLESTGIGILGGLVGALLGVIGVGTLVKYGIDFDAWAGMEMASFGLSVIGKTYGVWNPGAFLKVFAFGVLISFLASILPAYWAADKDPVKAIYHR